VGKLGARRYARALAEASRSLFSLPRTGSPRYGAATRAGLAIAVPLGTLTLLGHQSIGLQTSAGAFTALFAAGATARERAKILPFVMLGLALSAVCGIALTPHPVGFAVGLVLVATISSALCFGFRVGPPGPVFFVLSYGLAANVTAVAEGAEKGERLGDPLVFLIAMTGGCLFAYLVAVAPAILPSNRGPRALPTRTLSELLPGPWFGQDELILIARIAISSAAGTAISLIWLDQGHAYWTVCASVAVVGLVGGRRFSLQRGLHRTIGTVIGAFAFMLVAPIDEYPLLLVLTIGALQFAIELVVVRNYALALVLITPLVLLISGAVSADGASIATALERVADTAVGAALAMLTAFMHRK